MDKFKVLHQDSSSAARSGLLTTAHGKVETPVFMPVGTGGAVKGTTPQQLKDTGAALILANTYHLMLRPGIDTVEKLGGLHRFMAWDGALLTDSGGYQIFSLSSLNKVDDDGVEFASHIDGTKVYIDAEIATQIQNRLGADIIMCFDQCPPFPSEDSLLKQAVERTINWAKRSKDAHTNNSQLLFAVVQGGIDLSLRTHCAAELTKMNFEGYAIGGLSVGEGYVNMLKTVEHTAQLLPADKPRYLMGAGTPADIIAAVKAGVDMFDCTLPTRNGRNACAFTEDGPLRLRNSAHTEDSKPIEPSCDCYCCKNFSRAALRHFFNASEMLGPIMTSLHNLRFYQRLTAKIRQTLKENEFDRWATEKFKKYRRLYK
jgi:queuine tRNA-ribosyltransferase